MLQQMDDLIIKQKFSKQNTGNGMPFLIKRKRKITSPLVLPPHHIYSQEDNRKKDKTTTTEATS